MPRRPRDVSAVAALLGALTLSSQAQAISSSDARERAQRSVSSVEADSARIPSGKKPRFRPPTAAERIASGDMLLRTKDYDRAIDELNKVVELGLQGGVSEADKADGAFLLGEAYFRSEQFLSARRYFRQIIDKAPARPYDGYAGRALSRLVDIALRTDSLESLDYIFARIDSLGTGDATGSLQYARGKAFFARNDFAAAKASIDSLPAGSSFAHQGQYLLGVIKTKQATESALAVPDKEATSAQRAVPRQHFAEAIEQFRRVTRMPASTTDQRHVVDLAWMAIGRIFYETDQYLDAAEAYSHVDRKSPEFSTMLYELAWVYIRLGDYTRAQRALEVLAITDPQSLELADSSLLRADLMLRSGQFDKALDVYNEVRDEYDPIRERVRSFLESTTDPAVYYDTLTSDEFVETQLPPMVLEWVREEARGERVFAVIDDATRSRKLVKRSRQLVSKLNAVLGGPTRVKAFPNIKAALEETIGLINKVGMARRTLALGMDDVAGSPGGQLASVRAERRRLMRRMSFLPVTDGDFSRREATGERQWNKVSQKLQRLNLEADQLQAMVNALRKVVTDADRMGVAVDPASRARFMQEIEANERDLATYRKRIEQFREAIEMGRIQIGFGDQRFVEDDRVRGRFREVFAQEVALVAAGQDSGSAAEYARSIQALLGRADSVESRLFSKRSQLEQKSLAGANEMRQMVQREAANIETYASRLDALDQEARLLVGEVAMRNFARVRDRLKSIVLRADVGVVQQAWELREEQMRRVRNLQRERAREEQDLNDELQEVLDDAEDVQ